MSLTRRITYFGQPAVAVCDAKCSKAWGIQARPRVDFGEDPDDYAFLADGELGEAPIDPGTYEGGHAKPQSAEQRMNKWCVRECERCGLLRPGQEMVESHDMAQRSYNQPWKHPEATPSPSTQEAEAPTTQQEGE